MTPSRESGVYRNTPTRRATPTPMRPSEDLQNLKPAAKDFRIFWDNAYIIHHLYDDRQDHLLNIIEECEKAGNPDMVYEFVSTSKVSYPGAGIAALISSEANIKEAQEYMNFQIIGHDKLNQLRHVKFFQNLDGVMNQMKKHAEILRPKFEAILQVMDQELSGLGIASWTNRTADTSSPSMRWRDAQRRSLQRQKRPVLP